jgi:cytochrome P450
MGMSLTAPPPLRHSNPFAVMASEIAEELTTRVPYPPGEASVSLARLKCFGSDVEIRRLLLDCYERFGPVFTVRVLHRRLVFMLGPAANHYITTSNASNFTVRESLFRDIVDVAGDGIITTDGEYHRRMRRLALPALQADSVTSYFDTVAEEAELAFEHLALGEAADLHRWARRLIMRITMRTLFGFDPDGEQVRASGLMEMFDGLDDTPVVAKLLPSRISPWGGLMQFVGKFEQLIYSEVSERRARGGGNGADIVSLFVDARDEDGDPLSPRQIRDQVMTLLLASGGTTSALLCFFLYELARNPRAVERIVAEQRDHVEGNRPSAAQMKSGELVELEMALDEILRMYPSVWIGPRRATDAFEFEGVTVPANAYVNYCPLATHRLAEVFPEPDRFRPERFAPEAKAALPKGAYVPFGGGSRMCIGMRLVQLELRTITSLLLKRFELEVPRDFSLKVGLMPMLRPKGGLQMIVRERSSSPDRAPALAV